MRLKKRIILIITLTFVTVFGINQSSNIIDDLITIQAICQIELVNGELREGMISFGQPGYLRYYCDGFYFKVGTPSTYSGNESILFNLDPSSHEIRNLDDGFFIQNITYPETPNTFENINDSILIRTKKEKFKLSKKFIIHHELPSHMYIPSNILYRNSESVTEINVDEISVFKLVYEPTEKWINLISKSREKNPYRNNGKSERNIEPLWFHEIMKNESLRMKLMKYFQPKY